MKKVLLRKVINCAIFIVVALIIEMATFLFMYKKPFSSYPFLEILFVAFLASPIFFTKKLKFDIIYYSILMFIISLVALLNINFFLIFGDIFSLHYLSLVFNGGFGVFSFSFVNVASLITILLIYILFVIGLVLLFKLKKIDINNVETDKKNKRRGPVIAASSMAISLVLYVSSYAVIIDYEKSMDDEFCIDAVTVAKNANFSNYGMLSYYVRELQYTTNNPNEEKVNNLKEYFSTPVDTNNDYSGLLKDYNVVTIMIETGAEIMVNETLTPTLYQMLNEGVNCNINISKNKTNISEMIGITGSTSSLSINSSSNYVLPFSIPNILADDYKTMFFHDTGGEGLSKKDIYNRKDLIPQFGFENSYFHEDIHPDKEIWDWDGSYILDSVTMPIVSDMILDNEEPFYAFYTSLSMHGPYVNSANEELLKSKYYEKLNNAKENNLWVNPLEEKESVNAPCIDLFMMASMDFDSGLEAMINKFKEANEFDNTLFVIYGDHDIYYTGVDGNSLNYDLTGYDNLNHWDMFKTILGFYNPKLNEYFYSKNNSHNFDDFTSPYNIVPTILDLLGYKYNANLYIGSSLFAPQYRDNKVFYSIELSSFFNNKYWSYDANRVYVSFIDENEAEEAVFLDMARDVRYKQARIDAIYNNNLFNYYDFNDFNY